MSIKTGPEWLDAAVCSPTFDVVRAARELVLDELLASGVKFYASQHTADICIGAELVGFEPARAIFYGDRSFLNPRGSEIASFEYCDPDFATKLVACASNQKTPRARTLL